MPFDGTQINEAKQQLVVAKQLLIEKGWCRGHRKNMQGERCALGALDAVIGEMATPRHFAVVLLAQATGTGNVIGQPDYIVAEFNNLQGGVDSILQWFDRAIALA